MVTGLHGKERTGQSHDGTNLDAGHSQALLAAAIEIIAAYGYGEQRTDNPCRSDGMTELVDRKRRESHLHERGHLVAHGIRIEGASHGTLHPSIGHENPPGREGCTQSREPGSGQVESRRHLLPAEKHHRHEGRLHEEGDDTLNGKRRTKDIAHKPGIVAPVGSELKFEDDAGGHTHGKIDAEEFLPEHRRVFPETFACTIIAGFHNAHDEGKSQRERDE